MSQVANGPEAGRTKFTGPFLSFVLALVAAMTVGEFIRVKHPVFTVSDKYNVGMGSPTEATLALLEQQALALRKNAMLIFAIGGALLSGAVAVGAAPCCSPVLRVLVAIPWGALWGTGTGFLCAMAYRKIVPSAEQPGVSDTVMVQATLFAVLGAGVGLLCGAFGRSARTLGNGILGGVIAGGLGGMAFPIVAAMAMPTANTEGLIPHGSAVRLLWLGLGFGSIGLIVPLMTCQSCVRKQVAIGDKGEP